MTNLEVARHGILLLRSNEVSKRLGAVQPEKLSYSVAVELHKWNILLKENTLPNSDGSPNKKTVPKDSLNENNSKGGKRLASSVETPLPTLIKAHLVAIVNRYRAHRKSSELKGTMKILEGELEILQAENKDALDARLKVLYEKQHVVEAQLNAANAQSTQIWSKIDSMSRLASHHSEQVAALKSLEDYITLEQRQIEHILSHLVGDVCVAATTLVRTSWLPEQTRAECVDEFRSFTRNSLKFDVSVNTPLVLGVLADQTQLDTWSGYAGGSSNGALDKGATTGSTSVHLSKDPAAINSLSLCHLSPLYTLVIDPEGTAEDTLKRFGVNNDRYSNTYYNVCSVTAMRFSLPQLEQWVLMARERHGHMACINLIISDLQAGVSDDLIAFLSADLHVQRKTASTADGDKTSDRLGDHHHHHHHHHPRGDHDDMYYHHAALDPPYVYDAKSPRNYHSWHDTVKHFDLCARFNPSNATDAAASDTSAAARDSGIDTIPVRGNGNKEALGPGEQRAYLYKSDFSLYSLVSHSRHANKHACTYNGFVWHVQALTSSLFEKFHRSAVAVAVDTGPLRRAYQSLQL